MLTQVVAERLTGHVLDDLPERGETVIVVAEPRAGLGPDAQPGPIERGQRTARPARRHRLAEQRPDQAPGVQDLADAGRMGQQMAQQ